MSTDSQSPVAGSKLGITLSVMCAALMAVLDTTIVNVAMSDIQANFGTPLDQIGWVSVGYMAANVVIIPMSGWLQRRFGYGRYFTASILIFTTASILCGLAWSLWSLVAFRIIQGLGGGAIIPTAQTILLARYPKAEHAMAGALFGVGAFSGPLLGPALGGYLIEVTSWHWVFLVNVPLGLLAASLSWHCIKEPDFRPAREPVDVGGIGLLIVGMATLQYALEEGNREDWLESKTITALLITAGIALITFVVHELEVRHPVVNLRIFKNRSYAAGTAINLLCGVVLFTGSYVIALYCGAIMHYSARDTGLVFLAAGSVQMILLPLIGKLGAKIDGRYLVAGGVVIMSISLWMNGQLTSSEDFWGLALPQLVRSAGMGLIFIPLSVLTLSRLPAAERSNAAGLFNLTRELGGSIGTAVIGTILVQRSQLHGAHLSEFIADSNPLARDQLVFLQRGLQGRVIDSAASALSILSLRVHMQALIRSFNDTFVLLAAVFALAVLFVVWLPKAETGSQTGGAH